MSAPNVLVFAAAGLCFVIFALSPWLVFTRVAPITAGLQVLMAGAVISAVAQLTVIASTNPIALWRSIAALMVFGASLGTFGWAARTTRKRRLSVAFSTDPPQHLRSDGPYRYVRHPFYAAYLAAYGAGWLATGSAALLTTLVAMTLIYGRAARLEERKFRGTPLAHQYRAYAETAAMFYPGLRWPVVKRFAARAAVRGQSGTRLTRRS